MNNNQKTTYSNPISQFPNFLIMIKKLSWAVLITILSCCVFSTQLNAQPACPTSIVSCDADELVLEFASPADASAFAAANPFLFNNNFFNSPVAVGTQVTYNNASFFEAFACPNSLEEITENENIDCVVQSSCPDFSAITAGTLDVGVTESTCTTINGTPTGGSISPPTTDCPDDSTIEYNVNGGGWISAPPSPPPYNQSVSMTIETRCVCDEDNTEISAVSTVTTNPASCPTCPTIDVQPTSQTLCEGEDLTFSVTVSGGAGNTTYQWQNDCANPGTFVDIVGATNPDLSISGVALTDACNYQLIIEEDGVCSTTSDVVSLTVNPSITIDTQPTDQTVCEGEDVTFEVMASGGTAPLSYQWQNDCSGTFMDIAGATSASYSISNVQATDACDYQVIVTDTNACGSTSDVATLTALADDTAPNAVCQDITLSIDVAIGAASITTADIDNGSTDNCGITSMSLDVMDFTCDNEGPNTVTLTLMDNAGNSAMCTATVTVSCIDPSFDCPTTQNNCTSDPFNCNPATSGGTYSGTAAPFVMNDILNPTGMPPGNYTLTYTINGVTSELCEFMVVASMKSANAGSLRN